MSCDEYVEKLAADAEAKRRLEEWRAENSRADARFRELLRQEMRSGNTKPCPRCKQAITKNGGCHHHVCTSCKTKFCWNCGGFDALRPSRNTCGTTCGKREEKWWNEAEVLGDGTADGDQGSSTGAGASSLGTRQGVLGALRSLGAWVSDGVGRAQ
jgi:hypothetical protein